MPVIVAEPGWLEGFVAAGAGATVLATLTGGAIAVFRGRKGTVVLEARAYDLGDRLALAARPSIRAVGVFPLKLLENQSFVTVTEVLATAGEPGLVDGREWLADAVFGSAFVEAGEGLSTTVVFDLGALVPEVVGWRVSVDIAVARALRKTVWMWDDRVFVPRPGIGGVG